MRKSGCAAPGGGKLAEPLAQSMTRARCMLPGNAGWGPRSLTLRSRRRRRRCFRLWYSMRRGSRFTLQSCSNRCTLFRPCRRTGSRRLMIPLRNGRRGGRCRVTPLAVTTARSRVCNGCSSARGTRQLGLRISGCRRGWCRMINGRGIQ